MLSMHCHVMLCLFAVLPRVRSISMHAKLGCLSRRLASQASQTTKISSRRYLWMAETAAGRKYLAMPDPLRLST